MGPEAKFCPTCGQPSRTHERSKFRDQRGERAERNRAVGAMAAVFSLVLIGLVLATLLVPGPEESIESVIDGEVDSQVEVMEPSTTLLVASFIFDLIAAAIGLAILGRNSWRNSFAGLPKAVDMALGLAVVVPSLGFAWLWVAVIAAFAPEMPDIQLQVTATAVLCWAVGPALVEEWLCRGVLWEASRRIVPDSMTIVATAILFAMMHALGGLYILELPHRFVMGLLLGWLRLRSGSLAPCILAHFTHNLLAILMH